MFVLCQLCHLHVSDCFLSSSHLQPVVNWPARDKSCFAFRLNGAGDGLELVAVACNEPR